MAKVPSSILIVKTSAIGDVLQTIPILDELHAKFPKAQIDWVVEPSPAALLEAHPHLNRVLVVDTQKWRRGLLRYRFEMFNFVRELRKTTYDLLFDLQGNAKSGLITLLSRARCKAGYSWNALPEKINALATHVRLPIPQNLDVRSRYLYLVRNILERENFSFEKFSSPIFSLKGKRSFIKNDHLLSDQGEQMSMRPVLMICFGSHWENKRLSDEQLRMLLEKIANYCNPRFLFIYGSLEEEKKARQLEGLFAGSEAVGGLTLLSWQNLMSKVDLILAMDSTALHLAATTMTPTFSLFGPSSIQAYKPPGDHHHGLQGPCPYGIQFDKRCPSLRTCPTGACLRSLTHIEIFSAMQKMLDRILCVEKDLAIAGQSHHLLQSKPAQ